MLIMRLSRSMSTAHYEILQYFNTRTAGASVVLPGLKVQPASLMLLTDALMQLHPFNAGQSAWQAVCNKGRPSHASH